jgi:hypothetical protein
VPNSLESMRRLNLFHQLISFSTVVKGTTSNKN